MKFEWRVELPQLILIGGMFLVAAITWSIVPDRIPVHWNFEGEVDRYGGRFEALLLVPLMTLGIYALLLFLPRIDPGHGNYSTFARTYAVIRCSIVAFMCVVYGAIQLSALGHPVSINAVIPFAVGVLFVFLGNVMGKIRPNWFVGIRTPWTLSSKASWNKTHRLGGRLFMLMGLTIAASGLIRSNWAWIVMLVVVFAGVFSMIIYSWLVWRDDLDRISPADTSPDQGQAQSAE